MDYVTATDISAPTTAVPTPTTFLLLRLLLLPLLCLLATAGATSAAAAPPSAAMSTTAAALGKLRRYQYKRRMCTIYLVHNFVCLGRSYGVQGEDLF